MQFIDLKRQYSLLKEKIDANIHAVLDSGMYIMGPEIAKLEAKLAEYVGVKHCVVCSSGTDALLMPLMAWGIREGDAVFTTPFTFIASAEVIRLVGATPILVDVDPKTYNIDPAKLEEAIEKCKADGKLLPKAIIPVDLFGLAADYNEIERIAKKYNLLLLEDACQGFGATMNGKKACSWGDAAATSFFPAKPLGCYGDGGAVFTNDDNLKELLLSIRVHGQGDDRYNNIRVGINGRMDSIQAAVLLAKIEVFDEELKSRNIAASGYIEALGNSVVTPHIPSGYVSCWAQFCVLANDTNHRALLQSKLKEVGVPTAIYYPKPLHQQDAFADLGYKYGDFPVSEMLAARIFALPMHPYLTSEEINLIASVINA